MKFDRVSNSTSEKIQLALLGFVGSHADSMRRIIAEHSVWTLISPMSESNQENISARRIYFKRMGSLFFERALGESKLRQATLRTKSLRYRAACPGALLMSAALLV